MNALFGYTGFVGGYLLKNIKFNNLYNSKNINEAIDKEFDTIYISCIPAKKWLANKNPIEDEEIINNLKNIFKTVKANKIILISTIDIYDNINNKSNENTHVNYMINNTYGRNRYLFEKFIKETFDNYYIIRLPALYGNGLKKNIIYDLLNNNNVNNIFINSSFQWYNLEWLYEDINICMRNNLRECNLFTEPLESEQIIKLFPEYNFSDNPNKKFDYDVQTVYYKYFPFGNNGYIRSKDIVNNDIIEYIKEKKKKYKFDLCVSNIANGNLDNRQFYRLLNLYGIKNIEIAPTKYNSWEKLFENRDLFKVIKNDIEKHNLNLYSFQSITYTISENIFNETEYNGILEHLKGVIDLACEYNVKNLVFGCPKNRKLLKNSNKDIFIDFMRNLGKYIDNRELIISLENNSKKYGCNFLNNIIEVGEMCKLINHKNIKLMVDIGNCIMDDDNLEDLLLYKDLINHIHISNTYMNQFVDYNLVSYNKFINLLEKIKYDKVISLEFLCKDEDNLLIINNSLSNFIKLINN